MDDYLSRFQNEHEAPKLVHKTIVDNLVNIQTKKAKRSNTANNIKSTTENM